VRDLQLLSGRPKENIMADTKKSRHAARASAAGKTESKATAEFQRFKAARAAAAAAPEGGTTPSASPAGAGSPPPMTALPRWAMPPSFSLPQPPQGWAMLPQPGVVQPAPLAVGPLGDRLGSTLRLGIDVINMALAGSLRLLGGMGYGSQEHGCGGHYGCGGHSCAAEHCGGYDCCCVFEHDHCCTPSVGNCCD
jgi:hypothetical protein